MNPGSIQVRSTTILAVRRAGKLAVAGDGQVTLNNTVVKQRGAKGAPDLQ